MNSEHHPWIDLILTTVLTIPLLLMDGLYFSKMYEWFVTGTYHIRSLSLRESIGLMLFLGLISNGWINTEEKSGLQLSIELSIMATVTFLVALIFHLVTT